MNHLAFLLSKAFLKSECSQRTDASFGVKFAIGIMKPDFMTLRKEKVIIKLSHSIFTYVYETDYQW